MSHIFKKSDTPVALLAEPFLIGYDNYPSRCRSCHYCNHKCAKVANVRLKLPDNTDVVVELGKDCFDKFMGKKHRKCREKTGTRGFFVKCSICNRVNLNNRTKYNHKLTTEENSRDWLINPYICDVCDRHREPLVKLTEQFQLKLKQTHIEACKRFGKIKNLIDGNTFNVISEKYVASNFNKTQLRTILALLNNIGKYKNNETMLIKFILYFGTRNIQKNDESIIIDLMFLPKILMEWFLGLGELDIFANIGGVCLISESDSDTE